MTVKELIKVYGGGSAGSISDIQITCYGGIHCRTDTWSTRRYYGEIHPQVIGSETEYIPEEILKLKVICFETYQDGMICVFTDTAGQSIFDVIKGETAVIESTAAEAKVLPGQMKLECI